MSELPLTPQAHEASTPPSPVQQTEQVEHEVSVRSMVVAPLATAYHAIRGILTARRVLQRREELGAANTGNEFYENLAEEFQEVIASPDPARQAVEGSSHPPVPETLRALGPAAKGVLKAGAAASARRKIEDGSRPSTADIGIFEEMKASADAAKARPTPDITPPPQTRRERRDARKFAQGVKKIRDARRDLVKARRVFGADSTIKTGETRRLRDRLNRESQARFDAGEIDAFELERELGRNKSATVTEAPHAIHRHEKRLRKAQKKVEKMLAKRTVSEEKKEKLEKKVEKTEKKLDKRRVKHARATVKQRSGAALSGEVRRAWQGRTQDALDHRSRFYADLGRVLERDAVGREEAMTEEPYDSLIDGGLIERVAATRGSWHTSALGAYGERGKADKVWERRKKMEQLADEYTNPKRLTKKRTEVNDRVARQKAKQAARYASLQKAKKRLSDLTARQNP